jgi:hypothetical protein
MKSALRFSKAKGNERRKVFEIVNFCGRYSPKQIAKRQARSRRKGANAL